MLSIVLTSNWHINTHYLTPSVIYWYQSTFSKIPEPEIIYFKFGQCIIKKCIIPKEIMNISVIDS